MTGSPKAPFFAFKLDDTMASSTTEENTMKNIIIHFLHENGKSLVEIAREFKITPAEAAKAYAEVDAAKTRHGRKEKVVYRKRLSNTDVESRHQQLVKHMRRFNAPVS